MENQANNKKIWYVILTAVIIFAVCIIGILLLFTNAKIEYETIELEQNQTFNTEHAEITLVNTNQVAESDYTTQQITLTIKNTSNSEIYLNLVLFYNNIKLRYTKDENTYDYGIEKVYSNKTEIESLYNEKLQPLIAKTYTFYFTTPIEATSFDLLIQDTVNFKIGKFKIN